MKKFDQFMVAFREADGKNSADEKLLMLFERHYGNIKAHWDSCFPPASHPGPVNEYHGPWFHRGFRQIDVTDTSDDREIYQLIGSVKVFWNVHMEFYG